MSKKPNRAVELQKSEILRRYEAACVEERRITEEANRKIRYYQDLREELYRQYRELERQ